MDTKVPDTITTTSPGETGAKRMPDGRRIAILVIGDILVFLVFATIGRRSHGEAAGLGAVLQTVGTALPFAAGWFIVSPFVGAFKRGLELQPRKMALRTFLSWLASWPVAMALRIFFVDYLVNHSVNWSNMVSFGIVTFISNTILLEAWRWPFSLIISKRSK